jgi:hypothetical protein
MADTDWGSVAKEGLKSGAKTFVMSGGNLPLTALSAVKGGVEEKRGQEEPYNIALKQSADVIRNKGRVDEGVVESMAAKGARGAGQAIGGIQQDISQGMDPNDPRQAKLLMNLGEQAAEAGAAAQLGARQQASAEANKAYQDAVKLAQGEAAKDHQKDLLEKELAQKTFGDVAAGQAAARSAEAATREDSVWSQKHGTEDYGKILEQMGPYLMMLG